MQLYLDSISGPLFMNIRIRQQGQNNFSAVGVRALSNFFFSSIKQVFYVIRVVLKFSQSLLINLQKYKWNWKECRHSKYWVLSLGRVSTNIVSSPILAMSKHFNELDPCKSFSFSFQWCFSSFNFEVSLVCWSPCQSHFLPQPMRMHAHQMSEHAH